MTTVLAVDLGSASGRVLAGTLTDGRLDVTDIHRFKHEARRREDGTLTWDVATMESETINGLMKALEQFPDARAVSIDTWGVDWAPLDEDGRLVGDVIAYRDERTSPTPDHSMAKKSTPAAPAGTRRVSRPRRAVPWSSGRRLTRDQAPPSAAR